MQEIKKESISFSAIRFLFAVIILLAVWSATKILLLGFAAILLALLLNTVGNFFHRVLRIPYVAALLLGIGIIFGTVFLSFWLYGFKINIQIARLQQQLPEALAELRAILSQYLPLHDFDYETTLAKIKTIGHLTRFFSFTVESLIGLLLFILVGFYIAINPAAYEHLFLHILPPEKREFTQRAVHSILSELKRWVISKCIGMIAVGFLTFVGLWMLDIPLSVLLGLIAGLLAFIPIAGPILASVPAILIALIISPLAALYVIFLFLLVHFIEGYFLTPFIEKKAVSLPPGMVLLAQSLLTVLIGWFGLILATPLTVTLLTWLKESYGEKKKI